MRSPPWNAPVSSPGWDPVDPSDVGLTLRALRRCVPSRGAHSSRVTTQCRVRRPRRITVVPACAPHTVMCEIGAALAAGRGGRGVRRLRGSRPGPLGPGRRRTARRPALGVGGGIGGAGAGRGRRLRRAAPSAPSGGRRAPSARHRAVGHLRRERDLHHRARCRRGRVARLRDQSLSPPRGRLRPGRVGGAARGRCGPPPARSRV